MTTSEQASWHGVCRHGWSMSKNEPTWPATQVGPRPVESGLGGHDDGVSGVDDRDKKTSPRSWKRGRLPGQIMLPSVVLSKLWWRFRWELWRQERVFCSRYVRWNAMPHCVSLKRIREDSTEKSPTIFRLVWRISQREKIMQMRMSRVSLSCCFLAVV